MSPFTVIVQPSPIHWGGAWGRGVFVRRVYGMISPCVYCMKEACVFAVKCLVRTGEPVARPQTPLPDARRMTA